jgi:ribonucleoside-diphosphate reductase alpha chain
MSTDMNVIKRSGETEEVSFDKILTRVKNLGKEANLSINYTTLVIKIIDQLHNNIPTTKIDELTAEQCATMSTQHPDYATLAGRIVISNNHKNTEVDYFKVVQMLHDHESHQIISQKYYDIVMKHCEILDDMIDYNRDYLIDYFGFKTLERSYLLKIDGKVVERPQHMWMRVAICIHGDNLELVKETYDLMSQKYFTHATPTLFNAGTPREQLSSCFLQAMESDSLDGIYNTLKECASISKWAGGIGLHIHDIRAKNSVIHGTNGKSSGIVPMLKVFNDTARYVNQGSKRNGSFAIYLEPWHADIEDFLDMKKNHGDEDMRARDLFYGLWIPDLFMERIKTNEKWSLFCPNECPGLADVYGENFKELYLLYEMDDKKVRKTIKARDLWFKILDAQMETGTPYLLYKDAANSKSNQKNLGTIKSSNLCTEIIEYSDENETAVCNLASIALPKFVKDGIFNYEELHRIAKVVTVNLNKVIDNTFYPTEKTRISNLKHRPIGIGVQGLADTFILMNLPFHSDAAKEVNRLIFETIYHASLEQSHELAEEINLFGNGEKGAYSSFAGSPASSGILQFDMWSSAILSERYDWLGLKEKIIRGGLRNSLLLAPMPTASTSQILGYNECFEPITSNIYSRRTLAGEFIVVNKYLIDELVKLDKWNNEIKTNIIANQGSVQQLTFLPEHIRNKYKTVWEIPMKHIIDMSVDRGAFICQSQSLNLWVEDPNYNILTSMHFYAWSKGLKTGIYYLRRKAKYHAQQFTIEPENKKSDICEACAS